MATHHNHAYKHNVPTVRPRSILECHGFKVSGACLLSRNEILLANSPQTHLETHSSFAAIFLPPHMSILPQETQQGYTPPSVRQFGVFLDNKVGKLLDLLQKCDDQSGLNLAAFSILDSSDHAVVRLIFNNADAARVVLRANHFTFSEVDLLVVELPEGKSLTNLCLHLLGAELNIRFAYPVMLRRQEAPTVAIAVDDLTLAGHILLRKGFRLLGEEDLS